MKKKKRNIVLLENKLNQIKEKIKAAVVQLCNFILINHYLICIIFNADFCISKTPS